MDLNKSVQLNSIFFFFSIKPSVFTLVKMTCFKPIIKFLGLACPYTIWKAGLNKVSIFCVEKLLYLRYVKMIETLSISGYNMIYETFDFNPLLSIRLILS